MLTIKVFSSSDAEAAYRFFQEMPANDNGFMNNFHGITFEEFQKQVPMILDEAEGKNLREGRVPQTLFFLWSEGEIVGLFKVRHYLNDALRNGSGHIGFGILPRHRRKGYATQGLALVIEQAKHIIREDEIYMSCYRHNLGSLKTQLANGAYLHHSDGDSNYCRIKLR
jgi:predicted acetyltransferase